MYEITAKAAGQIALAWMSIVWNVPSETSTVHVEREGHLYFVRYTGPDKVEPGSDLSMEPLCLAIGVNDARVWGGSTLGTSWVRRQVDHRVFRAWTANGISVQSAVDPTWAAMLKRAKPVIGVGRSSVKMAWVEEVLGGRWTIFLSGRATSSGRSVQLAPRDRLFLKAQASAKP